MYAVFLLLPMMIQAQTLDDFLKEAAENNPELMAKYAEFEAALQRVAQVKALPDPTLSFGYFISSVETRVGPQIARFSLSQMFPWFGTLSAKGEMTTLMAEAKYKEFLNSKNELYYKVKASYYPLFEVNSILQLHKKNREILFTYKQLSTARFKNGKGTMVDVIRVDIMLENSATDLKLLEDKKKPLLTHFNMLLNRPDTIAVELPDSLFFLKVILDYRKDSLLSTNPTLEAFDLKIQSAKSQEQLARKQGLPKFGIGIDYVIVGDRINLSTGQVDMNVPDNGKDVFMPMVSMSLPIFRGKYKAAVKEAQFIQKALSFSKEEFENNLINTYEMGQYELNQANQLIELYQKQMVKTNQVIDLLIISYSHSGNDFEEALRMQQELLKYQIAEATAKKDYYTAFAKLDYLTAKSE